MLNESNEIRVPEQSTLAGKRPSLNLRAAVFRAVRSFFEEQGFLEVQTPAVTAAPAPESHIEPIPLQESGCLITSPELHMKRLLAAGYEKIYQICRVFRRAERGRLHHPEFTLLEWYRLHRDYTALQRDCRGLLEAVCRNTHRDAGWEFRGNRLDVTAPWEEFTVSQAFRSRALWDPVEDWDAERFEEDLVLKVEPCLGFPAPCFLTHYPSQQAALARTCPHDPAVAERFELYWAGIELANGFSELTDPGEQRRRFEIVLKAREAAGLPVYPLPEAFLHSLDHLKPCAGIALGLDRLVMILTDSASLDEVVAFPPECL